MTIQAAAPDVAQPVAQPVASTDALDDAALVARVRSGDTHAFELLMRRHNRRMFRIARSLMRDDDEAEDIVQEAYVRAWLRLDDLTRPAGFAAWMARITLNEGRMRLRSRRRIDRIDDQEELDMAASEQSVRAAADNGPEALASRTQTRTLIESAIDALPEPFRCVFMLRVVEQMDIAETAYCLDLPPATVKTRLHRARLLLQQRLAGIIDASAPDAFEFGGKRCDRIVAGVLARVSGKP